jgi:predicted phosphodiesterase
MARLWIMSDCHLELMRNIKDMLPHITADALIIAGDFHRSRSVVQYARRQAGDLPLIMVAGNHEHYESFESVDEGIKRLRRDARLDRKMNGNQTYFLENETVELELIGHKIRFVGATLWTDFRIFGTYPYSISYAQSNMNDFGCILGSKNPRKELRPAKTVAWHKVSKTYIRSQLSQPFSGKTVVITHHLPSIRSISPRYQYDPLAPAFASDCDELLDLGADLWIHGHTHDSCDYIAGNTRVICNPRGYPSGLGFGSSENKFFNPSLVIEV